jgi:hypothetical protein
LFPLFQSENQAIFSKGFLIQLIEFFFALDIPLCLYILQDSCHSPSTQPFIPFYQRITQSHVSITQWPSAAIEIVKLQVQFGVHFYMGGLTAQPLAVTELQWNLECVWKVKSKENSDRVNKEQVYELLVTKVRGMDEDAIRDSAVKTSTVLEQHFAKI